MLAKILAFFASGGLKTVLEELRLARLDRLNAENDDARIKADVKVAELEAEVQTRVKKLSDPLLKIPLFIAEFTTAIYIGAIMIDSTFPTDWLTPLELPAWFQPHFGVIIASIFGISAVDRFLKR